MDKTFFKRCGCALLALFMLLLCGCGLIRDTKASIDSAREEMNEMLVQFMTCIENNDVECAAALAYDSEQLRRDFTALREYWPARGTDVYELQDLNINANIGSPESGSKTIRAVYLVTTGGEEFQVVLVKKHDANGDGLLSLKADRVQELAANGEEPVTGYGPVPRKSIGQWCFTGFWILCCLFSLFTIIDVIRKKPKLFGLWILLALVFFGFHFFRSAASVQTGVDIGLLHSTKWIQYYGGGNYFRVCLPLGAIIYWCMRKQLLKKNVRYAVPSDQPPREP